MGIEQKLSFDPTRAKDSFIYRYENYYLRFQKLVRGRGRRPSHESIVSRERGLCTAREVCCWAREQRRAMTSRKHKDTAECCHLTGCVLRVIHHCLLSPLQLPGSLSPVPRLSITHCAVPCPTTLPCLQTRRVTTALALHRETGDLRFALYSLLCDLGDVT